MRYASQDNGNYGDDSTLKGIEDAEEGEGFGIPGQSTVGTVGTSNAIDGESTAIGLLNTTHADLGAEHGSQVTPLDGLNLGYNGVPMSPMTKKDTQLGLGASMKTVIAYVMENGEPFCNHCEKNFVPKVLGPRMACTYCGCGRPNDDHGEGEENFLGEDLQTIEAGKIEEGDVVDGDVIKISDKPTVRKGSTEEFVGFFNKTANDSELYTKGYQDAMDGKPLDEDLALLSDDYYHGYDQYKFYNKTPQQSVGQKLFDIKPNSNAIPRPGQITPGEADRGPMQLTDGFNHATASKLSSVFPIDVVEKFFEV